MFTNFGRAVLRSIFLRARRVNIEEMKFIFPPNYTAQQLASPPMMLLILNNNANVSTLVASLVIKGYTTRAGRLTHTPIRY